MLLGLRTLLPTKCCSALAELFHHLNTYETHFNWKIILFWHWYCWAWFAEVYALIWAWVQYVVWPSYTGLAGICDKGVHIHGWYFSDSKQVCLQWKQKSCQIFLSLWWYNITKRENRLECESLAEISIHLLQEMLSHVKMLLVTIYRECPDVATVHPELSSFYQLYHIWWLKERTGRYWQWIWKKSLSCWK